LSLASKLKVSSRAELASLSFYVISGIVLLAMLPFTGFPPHLALIGIFSIITAYSVLTKRAWTLWLVFIQFVIATTFCLWTIFSIGLSNWLITISLIVYLSLTLLVTAYIALWRKT
jgi:hypothetical protein